MPAGSHRPPHDSPSGRAVDRADALWAVISNTRNISELGCGHAVGIRRMAQTILACNRKIKRVPPPHRIPPYTEDRFALFTGEPQNDTVIRADTIGSCACAPGRQPVEKEGPIATQIRARSPVRSLHCTAGVPDKIDCEIPGRQGAVGSDGAASADPRQSYSTSESTNINCIESSIDPTSSYLVLR